MFIKKSFLFKDFFTKELLLYSWSYLKKQNNLFLNRKKVLEPISDDWFNNVLKLILMGKYVYINSNYNSISKYNYRRKVLDKLKLRIIEVSLIFLIKPFFDSYFFSNEVFLKGVLR